ncbi:MAG: DinB family protein [Flavobacteriales bacterium]
MRTNKLILKYIELSNQKENILKSIENYSKEEINFKPSEKQWSICQVIEHLIESETGVNKYVNHKLKNIEEQPKINLKNRLYSKLLNNRLKSNKKFKVPAVLGEPENGATYQELKEKWDNARLYLIKTVETFPTDKMNKAIFKHPKAGRLSLNQTLSFMINHLRHHTPQVDNLRNTIDNQNKKRA